MKTVLVFGASGIVGQGFIKASLDNDTVKVVGVFRSEESAKRVTERLGNPSNDKFVAIVGTVDSEANTAALYKRVVEKVGSYTDVVVTVGYYKLTRPLLEQSVEEVRESVNGKWEPNFLIAKHFLPPIQDQEGTSFTVINGGAAYQPHPNFGQITIANGALMKLMMVIMAEHKDKPIRINQYVICCHVPLWDDPTGLAPRVPTGLTSPCTDNITMGKGLLGVIIHPNSRSATMNITPDNVGQVATTGALSS